MKPWQSFPDCTARDCGCPEPAWQQRRVKAGLSHVLGAPVPALFPPAPSVPGQSSGSWESPCSRLVGKGQGKGLCQCPHSAAPPPPSNPHPLTQTSTHSRSLQKAISPPASRGPSAKRQRPRGSSTQQLPQARGQASPSDAADPRREIRGAGHCPQSPSQAPLQTQKRVLFRAHLRCLSHQSWLCWVITLTGVSHKQKPILIPGTTYPGGIRGVMAAVVFIGARQWNVRSWNPNTAHVDQSTSGACGSARLPTLAWAAFRSASRSKGSVPHCRHHQSTARNSGEHVSQRLHASARADGAGHGLAALFTEAFPLCCGGPPSPPAAAVCEATLSAGSSPWSSGVPASSGTCREIQTIAPKQRSSISVRRRCAQREAHPGNLGHRLLQER